jgi:hypothetical protein
LICIIRVSNLALCSFQGAGAPMAGAQKGLSPEDQIL